MSNLQNYLQQYSKKHLIFDLDETLVKFKLPWDIFQNQMWDLIKSTDYGLYKEIEGLYPNPMHESSEFINKYGDGFLQKVLHVQENFEQEYLIGYEVNKELVDFILNNKDNYTFYCWTSNTEKIVLKTINEVLEDIFSKIITRNQVKLVKPSTEGFRIINDHNANLSEYLFIGDSEYSDGQASKNIGIDFYKINYFK